MDGISSNTINQWVHNNLKLVGELSPVSIHLTDFLLIKPKNEEVIFLAVEVFTILISEITNLGNPIQPMMVIPLKSESKTILQRSPKNLIDLQEQIDYFEPPNIYLLSWNKNKKTAPVEEYREPLRFNLFEQKYSNTYTYYREHRYGLAIRENWEFARGVYSEFYPDGYFNN